MSVSTSQLFDPAVEVSPRGRDRARATGPTGVRSVQLLALPVAAGVIFLLLPLTAVALRAVSDGGLSGFGDVLTDPVFLDAAKRTISLALVVSLCCAGMGTIYALALVGAPRPLGYVLLAALVSSLWMSFVVRTFGWVLLFQGNGVLDQLLGKLGFLAPGESLNLYQTTTAMYPAMIHVMLPFCVLPIYARAQRIDPDLIRGAQSLGAGALAVVRHVVLPQLRPAILAGAGLVFIISLSFYVTPLLIGGPSQVTVVTLIDQKFNQLNEMGAASTMALLLLVVVLALYFLAERFGSLIPVEGEVGS